MTLVKIVLLSLLLVATVAVAVCPEGCTCRAKSIICTCEDDSWDSSETSKPKKSRLVLSGIANQFDYIESFVVHSCDHLVIPNDTFTGVSIHDQLKLVGIGRVDFRPHAFRRIRRSPRHFVVQNAGVTRIPKHAFSGLDSIEHFWWRNVTISSIDSFAFADVSKVEYVYFRDARVTHLHRNAFGRMSSIGNFYLRENIHIGRLGVGVFDSSQLAEVIFEDAQVSASDGAHLATFDNAKIAHLQLLNSRFDLCYRNPVAKSVRKCQVDKLTVVNSVFDRLLPENFCQIATFENATIASLGPSDDFNVPAPFSVAVVNFVHSHIGKITAGAFRNSRIDQLRFDKSDINFLARRSFYGSEILRISFADSSIDDAGASEPPPFDGGQFGEVAFARGFLRATTNLFARSTVSSSVEFTSIHFGVIVGALFMDSKIANVTFRDCNFDTLKGPFFDNTTVDTLDISKSRFSEELPDDFFEGGLASETKRFLMRDCEVFCNLKACEKNALLLRPIIHDLSWKFRRNRCSNAAERPCAELRVQDKGGLACRQRHAIEECVCMGPMALGIPGIRIPPSNASILVLGDCRQVTVTAENRSKNVHIYLYRVEQLVVKSVTPTLRRLEILHSNVVLEGAFAWGNRSLSSISLVDSNVKRIGPNAFSGARIDRIVFNDSQIGLVHSKAFENSSIRSMRVIRSRLFDADYSLPQEIAQISIDDSLIEQNHRLFHVDHIDLGEAEKSEDDCSLLNQRIRSINRRFVCGRRMSRSPLGRIAAIVARCERKDCAEAKVPDSALRIHFSSILFLFSLFLWI